MTVRVWVMLLLLAGVSYARLAAVYPDAGETVDADAFFVAFSWFDASRRLGREIAEVEMTFDGIDVSDQVHLGSNTIRLIPDARLLNRPDLPGRHEVGVTLYGRNREVVARMPLAFTISQAPRVAETTRNLTTGTDTTEETTHLVNSGTVTTGSTVEYYDGSPRYIGSVGANGNGYRDRWHYSYNLMLTSDFDPNEQSSQRFLVRTGYDRYVTMGLGDNNPYYHRFMLFGQRVRGVELRTSAPSNRAHLDLVFGTTRSAREPYVYDEAGLERAARDRALSHNDSMTYYNEGVYRRVLGMGRLHFGNEHPLKVGISFLKAKDRAYSISQIYAREEETGKHNQKGDSPKDNIALGLDFSLALFERKLQLFADASLCAITDNTSLGVLSAEEIAHLAGSSDAIPVDLEKMENLLVVNASTLPLPSAGGVANAAAYDAGFKLNLPLGPVNQKFVFTFENIGSNYRSLGYETLERNKRSFSFLEEIGLLRNRINVQTRLRVYRDNLDEYKPEPTWTRAFTLGATVFIDSRLPSAFVTFGTNVSDNDSPDSTRLDLHSHSNTLGIQTSYSRRIGITDHTITLGYNRLGFVSTSSRMVDEYGGQDSAVSLTNLGTVTLNTTYDELPFDTRLGFSGNVSAGDTPLHIYSPSVGATVRIIPDKFSLNTDLRVQRLIEKDRHRATDAALMRGSISFEPAPRHALYLSANGSYKRGATEGYGGLTYELRF
jgi:hypothetical protein